MRGVTAKILLAVLFLSAATAVLAQPGNGTSSRTSPCRSLEVFHRVGCPHCARALRYLDELREREPSIDIRIHEVNESREATERFVSLNRRFGVARPGVPAFLACDGFLVGFTSAETTGKEIEAMLGLGEPPDNPPLADEAGSQSIETDRFGVISVDKLGLPLFTVVIGLVDGFNPCAMWVLLFLLSLLVNLRDRTRMLAIAGTFVTVSGLVYFAFMAAWLNVFLVIGFSRALQIALGMTAMVIAAVHAKDFVALHHGPSLSIPQGAKSGLYARFRRIVRAENLLGSLAAVTVLALVVNLVELLCTAGLPALYTQILTMQSLSATGYYGYLALYNLAYVFDDGLMVGIAVFTLTHRKMGDTHGRWLKLVSAVVIGALGALLVFAPDLLR